MDSVEISTFSEDELDYEYQDDEVNSRNILPNLSQQDTNSNFKRQKSLRRDSADENDDDDLDEDDTVRREKTAVVDSRRIDEADDERGVRLGRRSPIAERIVRGGDRYVDLDDVTAAGARRKSAERGGRKSILERVVITANRRHTATTAKQFGIDLQAGKTSKDYVDPRDVKELFESLDVDPADSSIRKNSIYVKGVDKLSEFEVKRIFAEFGPDTVQFVDDSSCTVRWIDEESVVRMFLGMTKPLRRVRGPKKAEEGELVESDDEEEVGQVKEENGEDVAVVGDVASRDRKAAKRRRSSAGDGSVDGCIEINVEEVKLPSGKWRVVTKHVPDNRLLIARFATGFDIRRGVIHARNRPRPIFPDEEPRNSTDRDGFEYKWKMGQTKVRPGLNVFDGKGHELEWDYEHDTRFFASSDSSNDDDDADDNNDVDDNYNLRKKRARRTDKNKRDNDGDKAAETPTAQEKLTAPPAAAVVTTTMVGDVQIRSRGRGSKKFLAAMAASRGSSGDDDAAPIVAGDATNDAVKLPTLASDAVKPSRSMPNSRPKSADTATKKADEFRRGLRTEAPGGEDERVGSLAAPSNVGKAVGRFRGDAESGSDELEDYDELADVLLGPASPVALGDEDVEAMDDSVPS